jgi:uncharacterized protein YndB with AHSA1/START domain
MEIVMLKTILAILLVFAVAVVAVVGYAATKPDTFQVKRSKVINVPPDKIFPLISNLRQMNTWNPFSKGDPKLKVAYSGPESGKGAAYDWDSEGHSGKGRIEITDAEPPTKVNMNLTMLTPIEAHNLVEFTLRADNNATEVTWAMTGHHRPLIAKIRDVLFTMDRMVGGQFEKGLDDLKVAAEG